MRPRDLALFLLEVAEDYLSSYQRSWQWLHQFNSGYPQNPGYLKKTLFCNQFIKDDQTSGLSLLETGRNKLLQQFPLLQWRKQKWDKRWRVVIYDIPESDRLKRDLLRRWLKRLGFGQWQISVWVSPHPVSDKINRIFEKTNLSNYCSVFVAQKIAGTIDLQFAEKAWNLTKLNNRYQTALDSFNPHKRSDYLEMLMTDPMLPKELLPQNWAWEELLEKTIKI